MVQTLERPVTPIVSRRRGKGALYFAWHFGEMCAAMCLAWMLIALPFVAIARAAGTADPMRAWPEVATIVAAIAMSAGMTAQMRWRRHGWRCIIEMAAAMAIEAVVLIALADAGTFARGNLFVWYHGLMPAAMIAAMALRLDVYTSPVHQPHGDAVLA